MANEDKKNFSESLSSVISKNKKLFIGLVIVLVLAVVAIGVFSVVKSSINDKAYTAIDEATVSLADAQSNLSGDELVTKKAEIKQSILDLADKNKSNSIGNRAYMFVAEMDFADKNWESAADYWNKASAASPKAYTAAISWYNAAVCYEELGNSSEAITLYEKVLTFENFPLKSHTLFSLGRLYEEAKDYTKAGECYQKLQDDFSGDNWASLGMSRLLSLKVNGSVQ